MNFLSECQDNSLILSLSQINFSNSLYFFIAVGAISSSVLVYNFIFTKPASVIDNSDISSILSDECSYPCDTQDIKVQAPDSGLSAADQAVLDSDPHLGSGLVYESIKPFDLVPSKCILYTKEEGEILTPFRGEKPNGTLDDYFQWQQLLNPLELGKKLNKNSSTIDSVLDSNTLKKESVLTDIDPISLSSLGNENIDFITWMYNMFSSIFY